MFFYQEITLLYAFRNANEILSNNKSGHFNEETHGTRINRLGPYDKVPTNAFILKLRNYIVHRTTSFGSQYVDVNLIGRDRCGLLVLSAFKRQVVSAVFVDSSIILASLPLYWRRHKRIPQGSQSMLRVNGRYGCP